MLGPEPSEGFSAEYRDSHYSLEKVNYRSKRKDMATKYRCLRELASFVLLDSSVRSHNLKLALTKGIQGT